MKELLSKISSLIEKGKHRDLVLLLEKEIKSHSISQADRNLLLMYLTESYYEIGDYKKAKLTAEVLISDSQNFEQDQILGNAENILGKVYRIYQRYPEALEHYKEGVRAHKRGDLYNALTNY
ncbi:MAG: hypothetical protein ACFFD4_37730, partial [Candidatus Odinarchaeota archaeon]